MRHLGTCRIACRMHRRVLAFARIARDAAFWLSLRRAATSFSGIQWPFGLLDLSFDIEKLPVPFDLQDRGFPARKLMKRSAEFPHIKERLPV